MTPPVQAQAGGQRELERLSTKGSGQSFCPWKVLLGIDTTIMHAGRGKVKLNWEKGCSAKKRLSQKPSYETALCG